MIVARAENRTDSTLAPVLRPGTPRRFEKPRDIPHRVIYRDAADPGNSAPAAPAEIRPPGGKLVPDWAQGKLVPDWAQGRRLGE